MSDVLPPPASSLPRATAEQTLQRILRNSTLNLIAQGLNAVCNLVVVFALARGIGKTALGDYFLVFALIMAVQLLLEGGLSTMLTYRIAHHHDDWKETVAEAAGLFAVVVLASAATLLVIGGVWALATGKVVRVTCFALAACACTAIQVQRFSAGVFRAFDMFRQENLCRALQGLAFATAVVALMMLHWLRLETALAALAVSHALAAAVLLSALQWRWQCLKFRLNRNVARDWLSHAVPLGLGDVVRGLTWQLDTLLLGLLQPAAVVGIYSVAYRPLGPLNWLPQAVLTAAFPSFSRLAARDPSQLKQAFADSIRLLWVISIPIAVAIFMCAEPLIFILAGGDYLEAVRPMRILIWVSTLSYLSIQFRFLLTALGKQYVFVRLVLLVFAIELAVEAWLIPSWGSLGACTGTLIGELIFTLAGLWICRRFDMSAIRWRAMFSAALGGALMAALLWFARDAAWPGRLLALTLSVACYFGWCILFRALRTTEIMHLYASLTGLARSIGQRSA
ncbi:MAG: flippase [Thermoguttaceae bacterium]